MLRSHLRLGSTRIFRSARVRRQDPVRPGPSRRARLRSSQPKPTAEHEPDEASSFERLRPPASLHSSNSRASSQRSWAFWPCIGRPQRPRGMRPNGQSCSLVGGVLAVPPERRDVGEASGGVPYLALATAPKRTTRRARASVGADQWRIRRPGQVRPRGGVAGHGFLRPPAASPGAGLLIPERIVSECEWVTCADEGGAGEHAV
jgi:hypothetical protein